MKIDKTLVLTFALLLIGGTAFAAGTAGTNEAKQATQSASQQTPKPTIHHRIGTVASVTGSELVLEHTYKGKEEKTKFVLNTDTKKEGNIEQGSHATVYYHFENKERVATEVKLVEPKTEAKKS